MSIPNPSSIKFESMIRYAKSMKTKLDYEDVKNMFDDFMNEYIDDFAGDPKFVWDFIMNLNVGEK